MHRPSIRIWTGILLLLATGLAGCAAGHAVSDGDEARERGEPYAAALHYLDALDADADHEEARTNLSEVAAPAYRKKLTQAKEARGRRNLEAALRAYGELRTYLERLRGHNVLDFATVDVPARLRTVNRAIAKRHYDQGEAHFAEGRYEQAIGQYEHALDHRTAYRDAARQIAASYYRMATDAYHAHRYRHAAETYLRALEEREYKDARRRAALLYYHLGDYFLAEGDCRTAYADLDEAGALLPGFQAASERRATARECATVQVAFAALENTTRQTLAGMNLGSIIFQRTRSRLQAESSPFLEILTRQQLAVLMEEHDMDAGAVTDPSGLPRSFDGAEYVVFGELNQVQTRDSGPTKAPKRTPYEYASQKRYVNDEGETETKTVWTETHASFTLNTVARSIRLGGSVQVVDTGSRRILIDQTINHAERDVVRYATNIRADHDLRGENVRLDSRFAQLLNADPRLKSVNAMVQPRLDAIAEELSDRIRETLDRPASAPAPSHLDVDFQAGVEAGR